MSNGKESSDSSQVSNLPDDILLNCLARVSRLYYPTLSLVSKRFRSLTASIELYQTRTLLGRTETCLYLCIRSPGFKTFNQRWFTLCRKPTRTLNPNPNPNSGWFTSCFRPHKVPKNPSRKEENLMVSVPTRNDSPPFWTGAATGPNIYAIGVYTDDDGFPSSKVLYLDCRSHTWHEAPCMHKAPPSIPALGPALGTVVSVLDGKIYVTEDCNEPGSSSLIECFDPKTQIWERVSNPTAEMLRENTIYKSLAIDGKLYLFGTDYNMVYTPEENKWQVVGSTTWFNWIPWDPTCVISNVMYSTRYSKTLHWYNSEGIVWRALKGLEKLPSLPMCSDRVRLVNYGGKIAVFWEGDNAIISDEKLIWCAVIALERRSDEQEVYGKIEWCDVVLTVLKSFGLFELLAVDV
ncbi:unnamed protein product [Microthlaspi erraticum]|uniref:F-box domain-containing protein n=1 Tax=Microthlaspi erraticum TaxID=1685480 RepID=A0A6D2HUP2_9BRAS|nr:unnamed protein product [Microthlaspi erraticum]